MALHDRPPGYLKRLSPDRYRGRAWVHWTMTIEKRGTGWLDGTMHIGVRELLVHTCSRHRLTCPAYCLMPDHGHFIWMGLCETSDQSHAVRFFRTHWNHLLARFSMRLQKQAYDHVLTNRERDPGEFANALYYVMRNPERAGLVDDWRRWPHLGAIAPGYPAIDPRDRKSFPESFWKIHHQQARRLEG